MRAAQEMVGESNYLREKGSYVSCGLCVLCDILLFTSGINARRSKGADGRLAKNAPQSAADDVVSSQTFSSSFNICKIIALAVQRFYSEVQA